jgi:hypothetical protein
MSGEIHRVNPADVGEEEVKFVNPHIFRHEGVPNDPKVIAAIEK